MYTEYRELRKVDGKRNPQLFSDGCWAFRVRWDLFVDAAKHAPASITKTADEAAEVVARKEKDVEDAARKWVKWVGLLAAQREAHAPMTTTRGLTQLPSSIMESLMAKRPGDYIFWAAMSSTTTDHTIAESYANQCRPVHNNVLFTIRNITQGTELDKISMYPKEREVLLPPLSLLQVVRVVRPTTDPAAPGRIVCDFEACLITERMTRAVLQDLLASSARLRRLQKQVRAERVEEVKATSAQKRERVVRERVVECAPAVRVAPGPSVEERPEDLGLCSLHAQLLNERFGRSGGAAKRGTQSPSRVGKAPPWRAM